MMSDVSYSVCVIVMQIKAFANAKRACNMSSCKVDKTIRAKIVRLLFVIKDIFL